MATSTPPVDLTISSASPGPSTTVAPHFRAISLRHGSGSTANTRPAPPHRQADQHRTDRPSTDHCNAVARRRDARRIPWIATPRLQERSGGIAHGIRDRKQFPAGTSSLSRRHPSTGLCPRKRILSQRCGSSRRHGVHPPQEIAGLDRNAGRPFAGRHRSHRGDPVRRQRPRRKTRAQGPAVIPPRYPHAAVNVRMQIAPADSGRAESHQHLPRSGLRGFRLLVDAEVLSTIQAQSEHVVLLV